MTEQPTAPTPAQRWSRLGTRDRAYLLACLDGAGPRGREHQRTVARLLKAGLYRYLRLTPLGRAVAEHGNTTPA